MLHLPQNVVTKQVITVQVLNMYLGKKVNLQGMDNFAYMMIMVLKYTPNRCILTNI